MIVGILGLGLIGGSLARAYAMAGHTVYAHDLNQDMLAFAQLAGAVDAPLTDDNIGTCDLVLLAGDLFDGAATPATLQVVKQCLADMKVPV